MRNCSIVIIYILLLQGYIYVPTSALAKPTSPAQPLMGPGGSECLSKQIISYRLGRNDMEYDLFIPNDPMPSKAPVVIFMHGWAAFDPRTYGGWITHLVSHDQCIVVYPRYQKYLRSKPDIYMDNSINIIHSAMNYLHSGQLRITPDDTKVAYIGHSVGGILAVNLAALYNINNLPEPKAIMCVDPGKSWGIKHLQVPLRNLNKVPKGSLLVTISSDEDYIVGSHDAERIYNETTNIKSKDKNYIVLQSDEYGTPPLYANHIAPVSWQEITGLIGNNRNTSAYDYYCFWKISDGLLDAAFKGTHREYALGNTKEQRFMGFWSDGKPIKPLLINK